MPSIFPGFVARNFCTSTWATWSVHLPATSPTSLMPGYPFSASLAPTLKLSDEAKPGIPETRRTFPLAFAPPGEPLRRRVAALCLVLGGVDRVRRRNVAGERKYRHALRMRVLDCLVHRCDVRTANNDGINTIVDHLPHLLNLYGVLEVRLCDDKLGYEPGRLVPLKQGSHLFEYLHPPSISGVI